MLSWEEIEQKYCPLEIDKGWFNIVEPIFEYIENANKENNGENSPKIEVHQCKEKFGTLRFYTTNATEELNNLAMIKRLITCSTVYSFDDVYAPLGNTEHLYQLELGILDNTYSQLRMAAYRVLRNKMTVDEAVENYGKF